MIADRMNEATYAAYVDLRAQLEVLRSAAYASMVQHISESPRDEWMNLADEFALRVANRPLPDGAGSSEERQLYVDVSAATEGHAKDFASDLKRLLSQLAEKLDDQ